MHAEIDIIMDLLAEWDSRIRSDGFRRLDALAEADQEALASALLRTDLDIRWQAVARCLMDRDTASRRLRLFAARCALRRLEAERQAGREPPDMAWRAVELAERLARGPVSVRELMTAREELTELLFDQHDGFFGTLGDDDLYYESDTRLDAVPAGAPWSEAWEFGLGLPDAQILRPLPSDAPEQLLSCQDSAASAFAAAYAAALAIQEEEPADRWSPYHTIVAPAEDRDERAWQAYAFDLIVLRGGDLPQLSKHAVA